MQTLLCKCKTYMNLTKDIYEVNRDRTNYMFHNCPVLVCPKCNETCLPDFTKLVCTKILEDEVSLDENKENTIEFDFEKIKNFHFNDKFISPKVAFIYDRDDFYFIPGLWREWNTGFLTPVFFNIEVLLKFSYHPRYSLELGADTYGNIYDGNEHLISFGINRNGKVIMWLGDIEKLDLQEQFYLRSENIQSDHDISSEFYEAQIEVIWAEPSKENRLFKKRMNLHEKVISKFSLSLTQLEPETIKVATKIMRPIVSTDDTFASVIIAMNMIFVESINSKQIKNNLKDNFKDLKLDNLKGLKLLQLWIEKSLNVTNASDIVSPLFIVYDLRIAMAHLQSEETKEKLLSFACERLNLESNNRNYLEIYDVLLERLQGMYTKLLSYFLD